MSNEKLFGYGFISKQPINELIIAQIIKLTESLEKTLLEHQEIQSMFFRKRRDECRRRMTKLLSTGCKCEYVYNKGYYKGLRCNEPANYFKDGFCRRHSITERASGIIRSRGSIHSYCVDVYTSDEEKLYQQVLKRVDQKQFDGIINEWEFVKFAPPIDLNMFGRLRVLSYLYGQRKAVSGKEVNRSSAIRFYSDRWVYTCSGHLYALGSKKV